MKGGAQIKKKPPFAVILQRWVRALVCRGLGHKYMLWYYAQREWRIPGQKKGRHLYFEFQYECDRCGAPTKWIKWRYKEAFDKQHGLN